MALKAKNGFFDKACQRLLFQTKLWEYSSKKTHEIRTRIKCMKNAL